MRDRQNGRSWMGLGLGLILIGWGTGCGDKQHILTVAGSTAFHATAVELANLYSVKYPAVTVSAQGIGTASGLESVLSGAADIGTIDVGTAATLPTGLVGVVVALDAIAVIVHPDNPVRGLTAAQARDIFSGRIQKWSEVGGRDHAINRVIREQGSGTRRIFEERLGVSESGGNLVIADSNGALREMVANDAEAIGYISRGSLTERVRSVSIDGDGCTEDLITTRQYPLVHPILMVTREVPPAKAGDFILFVLSEQGRAVVRQGGFVAP